MVTAYITVRHYNIKQGTKCLRTCHSCRLYKSLLGNGSCMFALVSLTVWQLVLYFFLTLTTPAGVIEYIQCFAETPSFILTQIHPFTAGIGSLVIDNEHEMDNLLVLVRVGCFAQGQIYGTCWGHRESIICSLPLRTLKMKISLFWLHFSAIFAWYQGIEE